MSRIAPLCLVSVLLVPAWIQAQTLYPNQIPDVWNISAQAAAERLAGPNVLVSSASFNGNGLQLGAFSQGLQAVGFSEGIVLTTGDAAFAGSFGNGNPGDDAQLNPHIPGNDPDLEVLNENASVYNQGILEFDFVTTANSLSFKYTFGSDEYLEYIASGFNDAFGFFLSGPGISGPFENGAINLAMVGGVPVSVNGVNPFNGNAAYFFDNTFVVHLGEPTVEGVNAQLQYDGFTWGLIATKSVQCNQLYHMKLAICNSGDGALDSGVFIEKGGIKSQYSPPGPLTISPSPVCAGEPITLTVGGEPNWTYTWSTGQSGVGLQTITTNASLDLNSYNVSAEYLPGCSLSTASLAQSLVVHNPVNTPPTCSGVNGTGATQFTIQAGEQGCFTIPTSDSPNEAVTIFRSGGNAGGNLIDNNAFHETGSFCWTPSADDLGFHTLEVTVVDENRCDDQSSVCIFDIKVICEHCPIRVYYERRNPFFHTLPAQTIAGEAIIAGYSVDPSQQDGERCSQEPLPWNSAHLSLIYNRASREVRAFSP